MEVDCVGVVSESSTGGFWWWWCWRILDWCCGLAGRWFCGVGMRGWIFWDVSV